MTTSYRTSHAQEGHGTHYDEVLYRQGRYDAVIWGMEQAVLDDWLKRYYPNGIDSYLDFACGTGRITGHVSMHAKSSTALDISEAMMEEARKKLPDVTFYQGDLTQDSDLLASEGPFECITMFRFLLNAEPALREAVLKALRPLMAKDGVLICNNHGNNVSLMGFILPLRRLLRLPVQQTLSYADTMRLFARCGWKVHASRSVCFLPRGFSRVLPAFVWAGIDKMLARLRVFDRFGIYQMYVLKKAE